MLGNRASQLTREAQEDPPWRSASPGCVDVDNPLPCVVFSSNSVTNVETQRCVFELKLGCDSASMYEMTLRILDSFLVLAEARRKGSELAQFKSASLWQAQPLHRHDVCYRTIRGEQSMTSNSSVKGY